MPRADVAAAIPDVVARRREAENVHIFFLPDVFHERAVLYFTRRDRFHLLDPLPPRPHKFHDGEVQRHPRRQRDSLDGIQQTHGKAMAFGIALDGIEDDTRRRFRLFARHFGDGADLQVPIRAFDGSQLSKAFHLAEPLSKTQITHFAS